MENPDMTNQIIDNNTQIPFNNENNKTTLIGKLSTFEKPIINLDVSLNNMAKQQKEPSTKKPKTKRKPKVSADNFRELQFNEYELLNNYNYTLPQLKELCRMYKLKVSGNKDKLRNRVYDYLRDSYYAIRIQKIMRTKLIKNYISLHGPGFINKKKCVNDTDFYSLDDLTEIPHYQYYSFVDDDNFIYGFDICSLYNYIKTQGNEAKNPYNRKPFPNNLLKNIRHLIRYCRILKFPVELEIEDVTEQMTADQKLNLEVVTLFSQMDNLGFYTDTNWFTSLNRSDYLKFIRELYDIWVYRANLTNETKFNIYPLHGLNPFVGLNLTPTSNQSTYFIKKNAVTLIQRLISNGVDNSSKWLGASYCLSAITLVNQTAAQALPWLYESVIY